MMGELFVAMMVTMRREVNGQLLWNSYFGDETIDGVVVVTMDIYSKVSSAVIVLKGDGKKSEEDDESDEKSKDHMQGKGGKS
jgi:hypothetical protein